MGSGPTELFTAHSELNVCKLGEHEANPADS
jgi:hypothetical protein